MEFSFFIGWVDKVDLVDYLNALGLGLAIRLLFLFREETSQQDRRRRTSLSIFHTLTFSRLIFFLKVFKPILLVRAYMWFHSHGLRNAFEQGHLPYPLPSIQNQRFLTTAFQTVSAIFFMRISTITDEIGIGHVNLTETPAELLEPPTDLVDGRTRKHPKQVIWRVLQTPKLVFAVTKEAPNELPHAVFVDSSLLEGLSEVLQDRHLLKQLAGIQFLDEVAGEVQGGGGNHGLATRLLDYEAFEVPNDLSLLGGRQSGLKWGLAALRYRRWGCALQELLDTLVVCDSFCFLGHPRQSSDINDYLFFHSAQISFSFLRRSLVNRYLKKLIASSVVHLSIFWVSVELQEKCPSADDLLIIMNIIAESGCRRITNLQRYNKIVWNSGNPYNLRWQYKWKHAYYAYPKDSYEQTRVHKPEDTPIAKPMFWTAFQDGLLRALPQAKLYVERSHRLTDPFQKYVLPFTALFFFQFWHLGLGFKAWTLLPSMLFYTRMRDKTLDPDFKETYLREMMYNNAEIAKLFNEETIHVLDYDCEYDKGYPDEAKFPEFKNKLWRFFNSDTHMTTGFFKFGDLESGATMTLKFKTMPVPGKFKYQIGEPFFFYDLRAEISHNGEFKQVVLVDQTECLKTIRPFLIMI